MRSNRSKPVFSIDHEALWDHLHRVYIVKRGGHKRNDTNATPMTTYDDIRQLIELWDSKVWLAFLHHPAGYEGDLGGLTNWKNNRQRIQSDISHSLNHNLAYSLNDWFWHTATKDLAESLNCVNAPVRQSPSNDGIADSNLYVFGSLLGYGVRAYLDGRKVSKKHEEPRAKPGKPA